MKTIIISSLVSFLITVVLGKYIIPVLKSIKMGQKILDIGPRWHKSKEGTPTMGGLFFIGGITASVIGFSVYFAILGEDIKPILVNYIFILLCAVIGFVDDYTKFVKKQNKGLSALQKLVLQFASAAAYVFALSIGNPGNTSLALPFTETRLELGAFYYVFLMVGIVLTVNSVNLTDGIDGLASSVTAVAAIFFTALAFKVENEAIVVLASAIVGGCLGFLVYNFYPARVFMGDTGSLFLGGAVSALAVGLDMTLILVFVGIVYYVEALSVILQVLSYKLFKKRIFKMSPIHHHFEMCGWNEIKIVAVFSTVTLLFSLLGSYGYLV